MKKWSKKNQSTGQDDEEYTSVTPKYSQEQYKWGVLALKYIKQRVHLEGKNMG